MKALTTMANRAKAAKQICMMGYGPETALESPPSAAGRSAVGYLALLRAESDASRRKIWSANFKECAGRLISGISRTHLL